MPSFASASPSARPSGAGSRGSSCSAPSTITTSPPSRRTAWASSTPTGPPPSTSSRRGTASIAVASRFVHRPSSPRSPGTGGMNGSAPLASTTFSAVWRSPSTSTDAGPGEPAAAADQVDPVVGQPALLAGVGVVGDHEVAPGERGLDVDLGAWPPRRARRAPPRPAAAASSTGCRPSRSTRRRPARARPARPAGRPRRARRRSARRASRRRPRSRRSRLMSAAPRRPARAPCTRRTSRASPGRPARSAPRARRAPRRRAAAPRQVAGRAVRRLGRVDAAGQAGGDLLQEPAVAVRVAERSERAVAAAVRVRPGDAAVGARRGGRPRRRRGRPR